MLPSYAAIRWVKHVLLILVFCPEYWAWTGASPYGRAGIQKPDHSISQGTKQQKVPSAKDRCAAVFESRSKPKFPGRFRYRKNETYKNAPVVSFEIDESGKVSNLKVTRSSGVQDIDSWVLGQVKTWKFKPAPGCGIRDDKTTFVIDFVLE